MINWVQIVSRKKRNRRPQLLVEVCVFETQKEMQQNLKLVLKRISRHAEERSHMVNKRTRGYTLFCRKASWLDPVPLDGYAMVFLNKENFDTGVAAHEFHHVVWFWGYPQYQKLGGKKMNSKFARALCEEQAESIESLMKSFFGWWEAGAVPQKGIGDMPQTLRLWRGEKLQ